MGNIVKILDSVDLDEPDGWDPDDGQFNLPFTVELKEDFHLHWQDVRLEMDADDFDEFAHAVCAAHDRWKTDGEPKTLEETRRYGWWPGEEKYDFLDDRDEKYTEDGELCHHYRSFPRTEHGELYYDDIFQVELQAHGWCHIHYKNLRLELGEQRFRKLALAMFRSYLKLRILRYIPILREKVTKKTLLRQLLKKSGLYGVMANMYDRITTD